MAATNVSVRFGVKALACLLLSSALLLAGCQSAQPRPTPTTRFSPGTDPCSLRLDDIRAALQLYIAQHQALPEKLSDLKSPTGEPLQLTCPVSNKPYLYDPAGLPMGERRILVVVDPEPSHAGRRWGITIAAGSGPLITGIALITEPDFLGLGR